METNPAAYFDLSAFAHAGLFDGCTHVWEVLNTIASYLETRELGLIRGEVSSHAHLVHPALISIGEGTVVEPGAYIAGPCIIGRHCTIRHGAYLRGGVITGDHCVIGHATEVKNSILLDQAHAAHFNYLGDSILGNKTNLGAGVKCANLRFDNQNIAIQCLDSGRRKVGLILGDRGHIGCNAVPNPGTLVGTDARVFPCLSFGGIVPSGQTLRPDAKPILA